MSTDSWRSLRCTLLPAALLLAACAAMEGGRQPLAPARTLERARQFDLLEVRDAVPGISIDLRYRTAENVAARPLYAANMPCLLRVETLEKLKTAQAILRAKGYGLRIWDAYRPPEVQQILHQHGGSTGLFLSPTKTGWSRHCGGIAVDATLVDAKGAEQRMPTAFDDKAALSGRLNAITDPEVRRNLQILKNAMKEAGFIQLESEWWHFDDADFLRNPQPIVYGWQLSIPAL